MGKHACVQKLEDQQLKKEIPEFSIGDTVKVHTKIAEGNKERIQVFMGTVIARTGYGLSETFSLHRVAYNEGMERVFLLHSPKIAEIEVVKRGKVRKAKLYYLRGTSGKAAKIKGSVAVQKKKQPVEKKEVAKEPEEKIEEPAAKVEEKVEVAVKAPEPKKEAKAKKTVEEEVVKEEKEEQKQVVKDEPKKPQSDK